nr:putative ribonuclease H-like domain-containing protein [Tanacetum cinerariifolium]
MDSLSPQVVSAAKLPILNPNEFDFWKMRIEQYFLMTDYSLWEVILNGDSPVPTRIVEGVLWPVAPTTVEQRELKANLVYQEPLSKMAKAVNTACYVQNRNNDEDAAFDGKELDFDAKKLDSEVNVSLSNLSGEFEDCLENNRNEVNAAGSIVPIVGQNSFNITNPFSAASPSNITASPTHGQSSFKDASQPTDDPDMPELEDNTYSDDENAIGAEADFNNLETSITVSLIPTTRIHKDHPAPRAWYETLANYLLENGFQRGKIDQTLFIKKQKGDILLVQIYVDDIIFGATNKELCKYFEKLMKDKFRMSSIGELTFFLGRQVKQKKDGIFISQDKYVAEILRKFGLTEGKSASTSIDT